MNIIIVIVIFKTCTRWTKHFHNMCSSEPFYVEKTRSVLVFY